MATREISITTMPDAELVRLINIASAELARRMSVALPALPPEQPAQRQTVPVELPATAPGEDDKDFCLHIAQRLRSGDYIKAEERRRVAGVAERFPGWVRRQGLPLDAGTSSWREAAERGRVGQARER